MIEIFEDYTLEHLMNVYAKKYPYYDAEEVKRGLFNFTLAEERPNPICLKGRTWEMVKNEVTREAVKLKM